MAYKTNDPHWPRGQSKRHSLIETLLNIGSGFVISMIVGHYVWPVFGLQVTVADNFWITAVFTVVSVIRSYAWRRAFNRLHTRGSQ